MMPGIDGLEVCQWVKTSEYKSCFIVLLSAKGQKADIELGLKMGADKYLTKPFSPLALLEIVEQFELTH
jgi:DNA-binding response OmpR family regulator